MTDLIYVLVTLASFVALALLVGVLDRTDGPSGERARCPRWARSLALVVLLAVTVPLLGRYLAHVYTSESTWPSSG